MIARIILVLIKYIQILAGGYVLGIEISICFVTPCAEKGLHQLLTLGMLITMEILETEKKLLVRPDTTVHLVISLVNWLQ